MVLLIRINGLACALAANVCVEMPINLSPYKCFQRDVKSV